MYAFRELDNPLILAFHSALNDVGCPLDFRRHVQIVNCQEPELDTFYDYSDNRINICRQHWKERIGSGHRRSEELETSIIREMTKVYDHCGTDERKLTDLEQAQMKMCSIIRGTVLSGVCQRGNISIMEGLLEGSDGNIPLKLRDDGFRECVISRSLYEAHTKLSILNGMKEEQIQSLHQHVFRDCFADSRPFDRVPKY